MIKHDFEYFVRRINNVENISTLTALLDGASGSEVLSHSQYAEVKDMITGKINSHRETFDTLQGLEANLYYMAECYPENAELDEMHAKAKDLLIFWHDLTGCESN